MTTPRAATLDVPGARLYYEVRGRGPVLVLIHGGAGDAGVFHEIAGPLAEHFTVVAPDRRGHSRSPLVPPGGTPRVAEHSDDIHRLIGELTDEPALVYGSSSGAVVALDLLARHPERLRRVVVHEPPLLELLDDPAPHRALFAEVRDVFRTDGVGAAMARFSQALGARPTERPTELPPEIQEMAPRMHANLPVFLGHMLCPFSSTVPDLDALRRVADRLVPAAGRDSRGQVPLYGPAARLAELLGREVLEFPGGHLGCTEHPKEFGKQLLAALD